MAYDNPEDDPVVKLLTSIDGTLKAMLQIAQTRKANGPKPVATDRDLDGQYGNPEVKKDPRDWTGPSCRGLRMSECPADYLEVLAEMFDYFADQSEKNNEVTTAGKPVAGYKRMDAARARGWAKRMRDGKHTPLPSPVEAGDGWGKGGFE